MNGPAKPQLFFITGLPRSRTAWLANFFTHGRAFCLHDGLQHCERPADLIRLLEAHQGFAFAGNSDSLLALFAPALVKLRPKARWLHVGRPWADAAADYLDAFTNEPLPGLPLPTMDGITRSFQRLYPALEELRAVVPAGCYHYIEFKDLNDPKHLSEAWEHLLPGLRRAEAALASAKPPAQPGSAAQAGEPWPALRFQLLDKLKVTVMAEKMKYNMPRLQRLMKQAPERQPVYDEDGEPVAAT